jgi:hypothetical protein
MSYELHFFYSCSALLARLDFEKKLTVMFYLEAIGGQQVGRKIFGKKG